MSDKPHPPLPAATWFILASLAAKLAVDTWTIASTWPDFSRPKLGIAIAVPFVLWGLLRRWNWAMCLAGVICLFWIAFLAARSVGPILTVGDLDVPFPWSNLLAIPTVVVVLNNLPSDDDPD